MAVNGVAELSGVHTVIGSGPLLWSEMLPERRDRTAELLPLFRQLGALEQQRPKVGGRALLLGELPHPLVESRVLDVEGKCVRGEIGQRVGHALVQVSTARSRLAPRVIFALRLHHVGQ